jgi:hypothetical protein
MTVVANHFGGLRPSGKPFLRAVEVEAGAAKLHAGSVAHSGVWHNLNPYRDSRPAAAGKRQQPPGVGGVRQWTALPVPCTFATRLRFAIWVP